MRERDLVSLVTAILSGENECGINYKVHIVMHLSEKHAYGVREIALKT